MSRWSFLSLGPLSMGLVLALAGCSKHDHQVDRKPVFPVRGKLLVNDQPAAGAMVVLHPLNAPQLTERPRANVAPDGTFELTTYDGKDGAPAGEYAVTVEWRWPVDRGNGPVPGPNQLPPDYSLPGKSGLQVRVAEGPNELQPITIRR
jgi:hypothetical protein